MGAAGWDQFALAFGFIAAGVTVAGKLGEMPGFGPVNTALTHLGLAPTALQVTMHLSRGRQPGGRHWRPRAGPGTASSRSCPRRWSNITAQTRGGRSVNDWTILSWHYDMAARLSREARPELNAPVGSWSPSSSETI